MIEFDHVVNDTLRAVLEGSIAPTTNTLGACVDLTFEALLDDMENEDVPYEVLDARQIAALAAVAAHNDGDNQATLDALRQYWSV